MSDIGIPERIIEVEPVPFEEPAPVKSPEKEPVPA